MLLVSVLQHCFLCLLSMLLDLRVIAEGTEGSPLDNWGYSRQAAIGKHRRSDGHHRLQSIQEKVRELFLKETAKRCSLCPEKIVRFAFLALSHKIVRFFWLVRWVLFLQPSQGPLYLKSQHGSLSNIGALNLLLTIDEFLNFSKDSSIAENNTDLVTRTSTNLVLKMRYLVVVVAVQVHLQRCTLRVFR